MCPKKMTLLAHLLFRHCVNIQDDGNVKKKKMTKKSLPNIKFDADKSLSFTNFLFLDILMHACLVTQLCQTLCNPSDSSLSARLLCPWDFFRQEYWSGLPCPPSGDLPNPGMEPMSLMPPVLAGGFFTC